MTLTVTKNKTEDVVESLVKDELRQPPGTLEATKEDETEDKVKTDRLEGKLTYHQL